MSSRKIVIAVGIAYAAVLCCLLAPTTAPSTEEQITGLVSVSNLKPFCGMALQLQRVDWVDEYKKAIDGIADTGCDTVSLIVDNRQENHNSMYMYVDMRKTMTVPQLTEIINHAKERGLRVILMPILLIDDPDDPDWRGTIDPHNLKGESAWPTWFDNYREMIEHYARVARDTHVDVMSVGSELVSSESHKDEWVKTIQAVRAICPNTQLTYSSNWDRYEKVPFWPWLDYIGMNSYWTLGNDRSVTVGEIKDNWKDIQKDVFDFQKTVHKPLLLLEAGWCSLANAAHDPWDYTRDELDMDTDLQSKLYQGFFESWWGKPELAGFMIWEWHPGGDPVIPGDDASGKGYTPQGKPAEKILREWMAKPRWSVAAQQ